MNVFSTIRAEVSRRGWTLQEFCDKLQISRSRFYRWENTGDFPMSYLIKMAELFKMSPDDILGISKIA
ncbi:helix-turn-helix transcriptional regulator [Ruminococcus sp. Marseille-P6503]|uniref:helix-turn-helix domain-containing protein n=1 Tax=Ruminococcus sp. Marseille-P6503 TaxID=2364796 RepID=UPI000F53F371|nr:helix-turn-helix transcriptional regulator [Ruminococcus sp. Marseille-P6503]